MSKKAIVLLSGGLDSLTILAQLRSLYYRCYALSFDYAQKHNAEITAASRIARHYQVVQHKTIAIDLASIGGSALTDSAIAVPTSPQQGIPATYVPARNTIFLSLALAWAEVLEVDNIFIGVNAVDYSGYPDCRPEFILAFQQMANLATKAGVQSHPITIHTPLMALTKAQIILLGMQYGADYSQTVSCYNADSTGAACAECCACQLRKQGFVAANIADPTRYQ